MIEAFFVLHGRVPEGMMNPTDPASPNPASPEREDGKVSNVYLVFRGKRREGLTSAEISEKNIAEINDDINVDSL